MRPTQLHPFVFCDGASSNPLQAMTGALFPVAGPSNPGPWTTLLHPIKIDNITVLVPATIEDVFNLFVNMNLSE